VAMVESHFRWRPLFERVAMVESHFRWRPLFERVAMVESHFRWRSTLSASRRYPSRCVANIPRCAAPPPPCFPTSSTFLTTLTSKVVPSSMPTSCSVRFSGACFDCSKIEPITRKNCHVSPSRSWPRGCEAASPRSFALTYLRHHRQWQQPMSEPCVN
jgi:hypothetical protein